MVACKSVLRLARRPQGDILKKIFRKKIFRKKISEKKIFKKKISEKKISEKNKNDFKYDLI